MVKKSKLNKMEPAKTMQDRIMEFLRENSDYAYTIDEMAKTMKFDKPESLRGGIYKLIEKGEHIQIKQFYDPKKGKIRALYYYEYRV